MASAIPCHKRALPLATEYWMQLECIVVMSVNIGCSEHPDYMVLARYCTPFSLRWRGDLYYSVSCTLAERSDCRLISFKWSFVGLWHWHLTSVLKHHGTGEPNAENKFSWCYFSSFFKKSEMIYIPIYFILASAQRIDSSTWVDRKKSPE